MGQRIELGAHVPGVVGYQTDRQDGASVALQMPDLRD